MPSAIADASRLHYCHRRLACDRGCPRANALTGFRPSSSHAGRRAARTARRVHGAARRMDASHARIQAAAGGHAGWQCGGRAGGGVGGVVGVLVAHEAEHAGRLADARHARALAPQACLLSSRFGPTRHWRAAAAGGVLGNLGLSIEAASRRQRAPLAEAATAAPRRRHGSGHGLPARETRRWLCPCPSRDRRQVGPASSSAHARRPRRRRAECRRRHARPPPALPLATAARQASSLREARPVSQRRLAAEYDAIISKVWLGESPAAGASCPGRRARLEGSERTPARGCHTRRQLRRPVCANHHPDHFRYPKLNLQVRASTPASRFVTRGAPSDRRAPPLSLSVCLSFSVFLSRMTRPLSGPSRYVTTQGLDPLTTSPPLSPRSPLSSLPSPLLSPRDGRCRTRRAKTSRRPSTTRSTSSTRPSAPSAWAAPRAPSTSTASTACHARRRS